MQPKAILQLFAALVAASSPVLAELSVTSPTEGTTCTGGQVCQVAWKDDNTGVSLTQQGNCTIALYTGGAQQQTFLQPIVFPGTVNVATTAAVEFTVDPTVGPNSDQYFIRFSSTSLTQNGTALPYLSFSHKFTLAGMSGTFNQTVQNQIASASSSSGPTNTGVTTTHATTTRVSSSASHTSTTSHSGAAPREGISGVLVAGAAIVAGVVGLF